MPTLGTVRHIAAGELMPLHDTFKATPLGDTDGIHKVTLGENTRAQNITRLHGQREVPEFLQTLHRSRRVFLQMPQRGLGQARFLLFAKTQLHGVVTILFLRADLNHAVRPRLHDGHTHDATAGVIDARLANFFSKQANHKLNLNGDLDARREIQFLQLIDRLRRRLDDVQKSLVGPLLERFHRLLIDVR